MKRSIFENVHNLFRASVRDFIAREITPFAESWEEAGIVPRELWLKAGAQGFVCPNAPEEYGGAGTQDFRFNQIITEELARTGSAGIGIMLQNDIVLPYLLAHGSPEQQQRWIPKMVTGQCIAAIAMTEPDAGSDLAGIKTTAIWDGECYVLNGTKMYITNGIHSDLVIVAAKTNPAERHKGISLLVVERGMEGFERGRKLRKMGQHAQDTAELFFSRVKVPQTNLLGAEGQGFKYLVHHLAQERLSVAIHAIASAEHALEITCDYCRTRTAFGQPIGKYQNSRFKLAEMKTEIEIGRVFIDRCVMEHNDGALTAEEAAMAKWWTTELLKRTVDQCVQLHGGMGYMLESRIATIYLDARVQTIAGGTTEIMKELIGRAMGF